MARTDEVSAHYGSADLLERISAGVAAMGTTPDRVSLEDLAPVDEFHIGGAAATGTFLESVGIRENDHVLDIGCGLGGTSRFAAATFGCRVTGVDLTPEYVEVGNTLCSWLGMDRRVDLVHGDALSTPFDDGSFDKAFMLHVGMNIEDKRDLAREAWRLLRPGGLVAIYDVMRVGPGPLIFPVPWASEPGMSFVAPLDAYRDALEGVGFEVVQENDRRAFALDFFEGLRIESADSGGPPPLGLHILMGEDASEKVQNMVANISDGRVAPMEIVARRGA